MGSSWFEIYSTDQVWKYLHSRFNLIPQSHLTRESLEKLSLPSFNEGLLCLALSSQFPSLLPCLPWCLQISAVLNSDSLRTWMTHLRGPSKVLFLEVHHLPSSLCRHQSPICSQSLSLAWVMVVWDLAFNTLAWLVAPYFWESDTASLSFLCYLLIWDLGRKQVASDSCSYFYEIIYSL